MASSVPLEGEQFHQILKRHKKKLTAEINYDDVSGSLIEHNLVKDDDYCSIGELIVAMTCHGNRYWSPHDCIQVFKVITEHPKYASCSCAYLVINELEQAERSYSIPEPVESGQSEEEQILLQSIGLDRLARRDHELEGRYRECLPIIEENNIECYQEIKCHFNSYTKHGKYVLKTLPIILEKCLPVILENTGMYLQVICAACIEMLKKVGIDANIRLKLGTQAKKINELFEKLSKQAPPIDVKKVIKEDLLPCMRCIGSIVRYITSPRKSWSKVAVECARFKLIDTDNLRMLCYYKNVLEYLISMVAFLKEIDSKSPVPSSALEGIRQSWEEYRDNIIEAKKFYSSASAAQQARIRGWSATVGYSVLALGIFYAAFTGVGILAPAGAVLIGGGVYTEYYVSALPDIIKSIEEESAKEIAQTLDKIPAKGLKNFCTDLAD